MATETRETAAAVVELGAVALQFGRVDRITLHQDGVTPESDTDHTVMLGLIGCAFAEQFLPALNVGMVAQYALVHDLVEVYAGDTPTLHALSADEKRDKAAREAAALDQLAAQFAGRLTWVPETIADYESRTSPEARYVKALDKLLPKITHLLNGCSTIHAQGMTADQLQARYDLQLIELQGYAADFPPLFDLRHELIALVMSEISGGGGRAAEQSEQHRVSSAPTGESESRERLDPLAATTLPGSLTQTIKQAAEQMRLEDTLTLRALGTWLYQVAERHQRDPDPVELVLHPDEPCPTGECVDPGYHDGCIVCTGCYPSWDGMDGRALWPCADLTAALPVALAYLQQGVTP